MEKKGIEMEGEKALKKIGGLRLFCFFLPDNGPGAIQAGRKKPEKIRPFIDGKAAVF